MMIPLRRDSPISIYAYLPADVSSSAQRIAGSSPIKVLYQSLDAPDETFCAARQGHFDGFIISAR